MAQRNKYSSSTIAAGNRATRRHPDRYKMVWTPQLYSKAMGRLEMRRKK